MVYHLILEYNGKEFSGWQFQSGKRTVQGAVEAVLRRLFGRRISTVGASRTDAGVHASGQSTSFRAPRIFRGDLRAALNMNLPSDVSVISAQIAPPAFHARKDAIAKTYEYRIVNRPVRPALDADRARWVSAPLNVSLMRKAAQQLLTRRDFSEFGGARSRGRSQLCQIKSLQIRHKKDLVTIEITADRFLYRMARRLVGRLVAAGREKGNRTAQTMEAKGLTLKKVWY